MIHAKDVRALVEQNRKHNDEFADNNAWQGIEHVLLTNAMAGHYQTTISVPYRGLSISQITKEAIRKGYTVSCSPYGGVGKELTISCRQLEHHVMCADCESYPAVSEETGKCKICIQKQFL
jgi:hypothetical protein